MHDIKSHQRVNDILLGPLERPALRWLAAHTPAWANPDVMTAVGVFGAVVVFLGYWLTNYNKNFLWLASLGFVINWFGDSLDGTLARYRHIERPKYGFFVDHTVDSFNSVLIFLGLGLSSYVSFGVACLALIGYLLMSILVYVRTCIMAEYKISFGGFGPTESRVIAMMVNTLIYFTGSPTITLPIGNVRIFDWIVAGIAGILFLLFIGQTLRQARKLARLGE
jgi:archaetidylinositol phosphate synthase